VNLFQRLAGAVIGIALFVAAFIFTSVILALAAVVALTAWAWAWLWWRTRGLRRAASRADGTVIEGEYRVEHETVRLDSQEDPPRS
jgi:hypothetical protein